MIVLRVSGGDFSDVNITQFDIPDYRGANWEITIPGGRSGSKPSGPFTFTARRTAGGNVGSRFTVSMTVVVSPSTVGAGAQMKVSNIVITPRAS